MDVLSWVILAIVVVAALAGRAGKVKSAVGAAIQARTQEAQEQMAAYSRQMQAAAAAQAATVPSPAGVTAAVPAYAAAPAYAPPPAGGAARRAVVRPPAVAVAPAKMESPGAARSFLHDAFADPLHARRAIILAEILQPPPALR